MRGYTPSHSRALSCIDVIQSQPRPLDHAHPRFSVLPVHSISSASHNSSSHISPHCTILTSRTGLSPCPLPPGPAVRVFSTILTTFILSSSATCPNATCLLSNHDAGAQVMKNWQPFVFGPELAMESIPGRVCLMANDSSANAWLW